MNIGTELHKLAEKLYPINRSLTGDGVRETLNILKKEIPGLKIKEVPTGIVCFDWSIPKEWNVQEAYIVDPDGNKICDFSKNNLHLVGYSVSVDLVMSLEELNKHLYSLPEQPEAIPYVTSYYEENWGFCISQNDRNSLKSGGYKVYIDSILGHGSLSYGELIIKGNTSEEIFFSTYVCHPSMGNNELSGPVVVTYLAKYIQSIKNRRYSYRIVFIPETIGSIMYLSKNLGIMKKNIVSGFNVSCVGDDDSYSYLPSRYGDTLSDKVAVHILKNLVKNFKRYSYLDRGSDERQYCSPGVDLPVCSIMRTKYGEYEQYHTSLDDLNFISDKGLEGAYKVYIEIIKALEANYLYEVFIKCEPQMGKRGLYPTLSIKGEHNDVDTMMNFMAYADGSNDLIEIANIIKVPIWNLYDMVNKLLRHGLIEKV
jgi:aminopeptidase-like protein